ncbi:peroxiredoxin [Actinosynnema pretiosum subsp. pretiosum]|uniref:Alkyl hydroperoxide reductase E n=2 Tax=Actinosynnema TaxID=40566 RepID=C6W9C5_ACTMD|nr:peroxiredoxin [Actinosynnema mirum]ACU35288.1 alkyl hydroperoxide reductase/ Thiol specific antioxidant/ Mal allergen [Actinosynnema mirum DSM 43827]AXX28660.1 Alkyl hydroperoxide reductase subunit C-like protein [Actinosynnema pretiosum subsp. pretiosum]QUF07016.1 peroxiredoxin [Actinosynnema pretiosum subsp. pretiosum]
MIEIGAEAPDFTLADSNKQKVALSSFRGSKSVLLVFYPFAFSGTCTGELCRVRDELADYEAAGVQVIGVSVDTPFSLKAWAKQEGYRFPLLSDFWPHGEVARAYGVFSEGAGFALRGTFLIDTAGVVRFAQVNEPGEARDQESWKRAVAALA